MNRYYELDTDFCNAWTVAVATTKADADQYDAQAWRNISREQALRDLSQRDDRATRYHISVEIDGVQPNIPREMVARYIRRGEALK